MIKFIKQLFCKHDYVVEKWHYTHGQIQFADNRAFGMPVKMCKWFGFEDVDDYDFCSRAERRQDATN